MKFTKEQMQKLTPEQQEEWGSILVRRAKTRQRFLKKAKRYRGVSWLSALVIFVVCMVPVLFANYGGPVSIICVGISLWILIEFHAVGVNRRLDALVELLEADKNEDSPNA